MSDAGVRPAEGTTAIACLPMFRDSSDKCDKHGSLYHVHVYDVVLR